ncbi:helix-turn-helix transcriptional regulator [Amycolatopsis ultiminotia]|uniref:helix-turn-helix domain-containing protein n=1 Tax=Amycolatopsis ultiminotia TaxID=543629 RepID=UPI0031E50B13
MRARKAAGLTQEELAELMEADVSSIRDWESGRSEPLPRRRVRLATALRISSAELENLLRDGADTVTVESAIAPTPLATNEAEPSGVTALAYAASLEQTLRTLSGLVRADDQGIAASLAGTVAVDLSAESVLNWLFGDRYDDVVLSGRPVSVLDIDEVMATTKALDGLDRRFGGDYARGLAVKYLNDRVLPQLRRPGSDSLRHELFQAAAVLCEVIGYMAYDGQQHQLAQHYFVQSLRLAKEAGSSVYGSFVLATMSHQALYRERPDQALVLARAAQQGAPTRAVPVVAAEAAMLEATASAAAGDRSASLRALAQAEAAFERRTAETVTQYWDESVFASFASSAWLDLGHQAAAAPYLDMVWSGAGQQVRRKVFAAGQLARAALLEHDVERSVHYGTIAADAAAAAQSKRSHRVVGDLLTQLADYKQLPPVRELSDRVAALQPSEEP